MTEKKKKRGQGTVSDSARDSHSDLGWREIEREREREREG
jgi:hypothetical protein